MNNNLNETQNDQTVALATSTGSDSSKINVCENSNNLINEVFENLSINLVKEIMNNDDAKKEFTSLLKKYNIQASGSRD